MTATLSLADPVVISTRALCKSFGPFVAVDRLDLTINRGEVVGFIGPNGAGKSTTIRMLCGLLKPTSGSAVVAGHDVAREPEALRAQIGYMSQKFSLYGDLTVKENLRFFAGMYSVARDVLAERMTSAMEMAGLEAKEDVLVRTLAGGWKQRLALGCAILHRPKVLFLDEPTSGVEPQARRRFWDLIHGLAGEGVTILVSTHYMDEAEYCNRIALINSGRLVAVGSPGELRAHHLDGELFELASSISASTLKIVKAIPGVVDAAIFGDKLHVLAASDSATTVSLQLERLAARAGCVRRITPSLEDVFVRLVARRDGEVLP
ncbi:ABC transporter ATP-binding protein [Rhizobium sp. BK376]|uniref:ABC transporter ATP-binding protein n=1 Tax=Rhizobium sp. BK376 TaxID=2512149 RepID=UPI0010469D66|nr:ABC transporter ATP-binding protein [Rhizobium sp. BK376]TCR75626.1 ABC-2 type transport system ATP-binding protein [Rhizobium sp. BK376]